MTFGVASRGFTGFQGSLLYICSVISWSLLIKSLAIANHCGFLNSLLPPSFAFGCEGKYLFRYSCKLFPLNFSVTVPVSGRSFGWFPHSRVVPLIFEALVPKLINLCWVKYHFWRKRYLFCIPYIDKWCPFHIHVLSLEIFISLNRSKYTFF